MSPPGQPRTAAPRGDLVYFFLSYARLGPLFGDSQHQTSVTAAGSGSAKATEYGPSTEAEPEIQKFFEELDAEIVRRTRRRAPSGFYDRQIRFDADPRKALSDALSRAQVFVPLYSPNYLKTSWTRREQSAFGVRMMQQRQDPDSRILPVLWTPVPPWTVHVEDQQPLERARALAPDVSEYPENGLRALCLLSIYADAYRRVLGHIATQIIRIAETTPVSPVVSVDLDQVPDASTRDPSFVITVLTGGTKLAPESPWHPYSDRQDLPVAEYTHRIAERIGLAPSVVEFERFADESAHNPGLAVVDPRILRQPDGENRLRRAFVGLPSWVRPLVVGDSRDPTLDALTERAHEVLSESAPPSSDLRVRAVERVDGPQDLETKLPLALAKTRQAYLRYGSFNLPPSSAPRPRSTGDDEPLNGRESDANH